MPLLSLLETRVQRLQAILAKFNSYHDRLGCFASGHGGSSRGAGAHASQSTPISDIRSMGVRQIGGLQKESKSLIADLPNIDKSFNGALVPFLRKNPIAEVHVLGGSGNASLPAFVRYSVEMGMAGLMLKNKHLYVIRTSKFPPSNKLATQPSWLSEPGGYRSFKPHGDSAGVAQQ